MAQETKHVIVEWIGDLRFSAGAPNGPRSFIDGDNASAPGPMLTLLGAAGSCSASDVVMILQKKQVKLSKLTVELAGLRREQAPNRYLSIALVWHLAGEGLDEVKARHAIELSVEKYCSVMASLAPDLRITNEIHIEAT
ncbi:MAG: OsmC family protein [Gemmatimonadota bacterium]